MHKASQIGGRAVRHWACARRRIESFARHFAAAQKDGYGEQDIDVRLKGSAAVIYSGRHKELPTEMSKWRIEFSKARHQKASLAEETTISDSFQRPVLPSPAAVSKTV
jgi:hypothetical protein